MSTDPGTFTVVDTLTRDTTLPHLKEKIIRQHITYKTQKKFKSISGNTRWYLLSYRIKFICISYSTPFTGESLHNQLSIFILKLIVIILLQIQMQNITCTFKNIGETTINDVRDSLTKETVIHLVRC